uniref:Hin recombinase n=1 Tax=uncultured Sphingomonas sp. TaxID=158754 RepID=UPI0035CBE073
MTTTIAFLAETPGSASVRDQQTCLKEVDIQVFAGRKTFSQLGEILARRGIRLTAGDRVKVHDLSCLSLTTPMLIRAVAKLLKGGVSLELCSPAIVIEPNGADRLHTMLDALDTHYRHIHGIKTHPKEMAQAGRKRLLDPNMLPEIRAKLNELGATTTDVALSLGVARSTLFNYLERYDLDRRVNRQKKGVGGRSEDGCDDVEVAGPHGDNTTS